MAKVPFEFTRSEYREAVELIARMMTRTGVTSVHDAEATPEPQGEGGGGG